MEGLDLFKQTLAAVISSRKYHLLSAKTGISSSSSSNIFLLHIPLDGQQITPSVKMVDDIAEGCSSNVFSMVVAIDPANATSRDKLVRAVRTCATTVKIPDNTLLACIVHTGECVKLQVEGLGEVFHPMIGSTGLIFSCFQSNENNYCQTEVDPTELIFEFARKGINPVYRSDLVHHFHPNGAFSAYFQKHRNIVFRTPLLDDLEDMCSMDEDSWEDDLRYPRNLIEAWIQNKPKDILLMFQKDNKISSPVALGAIYTRRIKDPSSIDSKPWKESIAEISGVVEDIQSETSNEGKVKQLLRVSTKSGGKKGSECMPGNSLRDFALIIAASQGCEKVLAITRASDFSISTEISSYSAEEDCYDAFIQSVLLGKRQDRGLNFHLDAGASISRKTKKNWIEEDLRNGGFGVIVQYNFEQGTSRVKNVGRKMNDRIKVDYSKDEIQNEIERILSEHLKINAGKLKRSRSLTNLGADSLDLHTIASNLQKSFHISISPTIFFSAPDIDLLTNSIHSKINVLQNSVIEPVLYKKPFDGRCAVIGMSCRFPGEVTNIREFWKLLMTGNQTSSRIPFERWDCHYFAIKSELTKEQTKQVSHGSFVHDMEWFDPSFFGISTEEARLMAPMQRVLLECAYLTFLDAGYHKDTMKELNCGVFVGNFASPNSDNMNKKSVYGATGSAASIAAGRIAYVFDLQGPTATYDTACSSSLVALDAAVSAISQGKCEMALVAGINELFNSNIYESLSRAGMLSPTGNCHTWDASADGYLRGEGCGAILITSADVCKSGSIYATILGTSVMSDGKSATITAPNGLAQERLIRKALEVSGCHPDEVDYIEAHGTGTSLGDPIELDALASVFASSKREKPGNALMVGSVKANIGHLEGAAGMAGLIKAILVLQHKCVPPNVGLKDLNPLIAKTITSKYFNVEFPTEAISLQSLSNSEDDAHDEKLLVAGVSSFGYSGTIAHTIIQQPPAQFLRSVMNIEEEVKIDHHCRRSLFLFTGQGSQYLGMGKALYEQNANFRVAMDQCEGIYASLTGGMSLLEVIFGSDDNTLLLNAQPALLAIEWSLAEVMRVNDIVPYMVVGHSVGEISAACVAGGLSVEAAFKLIVARSRLVNQLPSNDGSMVAIRCSMAEAEKAISSCLREEEQNLIGIASINGPSSVVLSGVREVVDKVLASLGKDGIYLKVSHGFHSPLMKGMEGMFRDVLKTLGDSSQKPLSIPLASTVTGRVMKVGERIDIEHWVTQLTSTVLFEDAFMSAMSEMINADIDVSINTIVEIGPMPVLTKLAKSLWKPSGEGDEGPVWITSLSKDSHDVHSEECLDLAHILIGVRSKLNDVFPNRERMPSMSPPPHPLLQSWSSISSIKEFDTIFHSRLLEYYEGYTIQGRAIFPGAGFVEMGIAAGALMNENGINNDIELMDVRFMSPLDIEDDCRITSIHHIGGGMEFMDMSSGNDASLATPVATIGKIVSGSSLVEPSRDILADLKEKCTNEVLDIREHYIRLEADGNHNGAFQSVKRAVISRDGKSILGALGVRQGFDHEHDRFYHFPPAVLDGALQLLGLLPSITNRGDSMFVPASISQVSMYHTMRLNGDGEMLWAFMEIVEDGKRSKVCNIRVMDASGATLLTLDRISYAILRSNFTREDSLYTSRWIKSSGKVEGGKIIDDDIYKNKIGIIQLRGCQPFNTTIMDGINVDGYVMSYDDIKVVTDIENIPLTLIIPVISLDVDFSTNNCSILEECISLLQILSLKIRDAAPTDFYRICFWTRNAEGARVKSSTLKEDMISVVNIEDEKLLALVGSSIQGMIRSAIWEFESTMLRIIAVDSDSCCNEEDGLVHVLNELSSSDDEAEVSYRDGSRYVRRLQQCVQPIIGDRMLRLNGRDSLETIEVVPSLSSSMDDSIPYDHVEVSIHAVGLNFKDVLNMLTPDDAAYVGFDAPPLPGSCFTGVVSRIGELTSESRSHFSAGDKVYGLHFEMLRSRQYVPIHSLAKMPNNLTFEETSTLPMVFLTILFALQEQADLQTGDRILIHSAAGDIGLAAIQYAKLVGSEIYATASPSKHEYLQSIGVENVTTSRDGAQFKDEMGSLIGEGKFDVILSAGNLTEESLVMLRAGGYFIELGKRNIFDHDDLAKRRPDVKYITHTLNDELFEKPEKTASMLNKLTTYIESGCFSPLRYEAHGFHKTGLRSAFKKLRDGRNIGKVIIQIRNESNIGIAIITGGLGGLGITTAEVLFEIGAEHVVLVSRSGEAKDYDGQNLQARLDALFNHSGRNRISIECCDMSIGDDVKSLLHRVRTKHGSINTIIHASGVINVNLLQNMDLASVHSTFGPKASGAWYLHEHTISDDVRNFVVYSSIASLFGYPGLVNYSAANSYLDMLVELRSQIGLPAISIQWPAIAEVGMAAANADVLRVSIDEQLRLSQMKDVLKQVFFAPSSDGDQVLAPLPYALFDSVSTKKSRYSSFFSDVSRTDEIKYHTKAFITPSALHLPSKAWSLDEIQTKVEITVKRLILLDDDKVNMNVQDSLMELGMDSLASIELSTALNSLFGVELPATFVLNVPTIAGISNYLYKHLRPTKNDIEAKKGQSAYKLSQSSLFFKNEVTNEESEVDSCGSKRKIKFIQEKKPKVLFLHGEYTNEDVASYLLKMTKYDRLVDFVIPSGLYKGTIVPDSLKPLLGIETLEKMGMYSSNKDYWKWGCRYELMEEDPSTIDNDIKESFQQDLANYIEQIDRDFGPFDGVMGFCEGGAALNCALGMREANKLRNGALESVKFFIHLAPWISPMAGSYSSKPKSIPTLTAYGKNDPIPGFQAAYAKYNKNFNGYYDEYVHDGEHNYPLVTVEFKEKIMSVIREANFNGMKEDMSERIFSNVRDSESTRFSTSQLDSIDHLKDHVSSTTRTTDMSHYTKHDKEKSLHQKCIQVVFDNVWEDISIEDITSETSLSALAMDSLHILEMLTELEEMFGIKFETEDEEAMYADDRKVQDVIDLVTSYYY